MGKRILVVEDEIHLQKLIAFILERDGHQITVANNGEEGLKILQGSAPPPDLILLDILMPGMDGLTVLRNMRADPKLKDITVILLTALAQANVVLQGIHLGVKDYIRKPFQPKELSARVAKVLGGGVSAA